MDPNPVRGEPPEQGNGRGVESGWMVGTRDEKRDVRLRMKKMRAALSAAEAGALGRAAGRRLDALLAFLDARRVAIYAAVRGELDLSWLWGSHAGRRYFFPRVAKDVLQFCPVRRPEAELQPGTLRIPEPIGDIPAFDVNELDVVVVPGLAFDPCGARLGIGGGFYDRTFARRSGGPLLVGAGYAFQLLADASWKRDSWDVGVDWVITEREALRCLPRAYTP